MTTTTTTNQYPKEMATINGILWVAYNEEQEARMTEELVRRMRKEVAGTHGHISAQCVAAREAGFVACEVEVIR